LCLLIERLSGGVGCHLRKRLHDIVVWTFELACWNVCLGGNVLYGMRGSEMH
jgi:hypothetical protein